MNRRVAVVVGISLSVLVALVLLHPAPKSEPVLGPTQRRVALDSLTPVGWLSPTELLLGKSVVSPALPPLPQNTDIEHYTLPSVSPDGQWLLSWEALYRPGVVRFELSAERWRVTRRDGRETRVLPSNGTFLPIRKDRPHHECVPTLDLRWLPDSSGWVVRHRLVSDKTVFFRYRLTTPNALPESLPLPSSALPWLNDPWNTPKPAWLGVTPDGKLIFAPVGSHHVALFANDGRQEHSVPLPFPKDVDYKMEYGMEGQIYCDGEPQLTSDSRALLAPLRSKTADTPLEIWRLPLDGAPAQKLATLGQHNKIYRYSLSPDQKHLLYWQKEAAYAITLE